MRVYLQVSHRGTEFFPAVERAKQAAPCGHREVKAIEAFHQKGSTITPALLAIKHGVQDKQGLIPGGYVVHLIFLRVPGTRLADDRILPAWRPKPHAFFEKFNEIQRDETRMWFDKEYPKLTAMGWEPNFPWATHLVWNPAFQKL